MQFNDIRDFWEQSDGTLWIAAAHDGLYFLKPENRDSLLFSKFNITSEDSTPINLHSVFALYEDGYGDLWMGIPTRPV